MNSISQATILISKKTCIRNIQRMNEKAGRHGLILRPHFKTHRQTEVGRWFRELGISRITVSNVDMAELFVEDGWDDLTLAFPLNIREIDRINSLGNRAKLNILIDEPAHLSALEMELKSSLGAFIKIDTSYGRAGIAWNKSGELLNIYHRIKKNNNLEFKGILSHNGKTYEARGREEVESLHQESVLRMKQASSALPGSDRGMISIGDTPSASLSESFEGVDEIRPGNFVYFDLMQWQIGSCSLDDIAAYVAAPIISKYPERQEFLIQAGSIHLSKEQINITQWGRVYGMVFSFHEPKNDLEEPKTGSFPSKIRIQGYLARLSQEHGICKVDKDFFNAHKTGDIIGILPVHSCLLSGLPSRIIEEDYL